MSEELTAQEKAPLKVLSACESAIALSGHTIRDTIRDGVRDAVGKLLSDLGVPEESFGPPVTVLHFSAHGSFEERPFGETSLVLSRDERISPADLASWYAKKKLPELIPYSTLDSKAADWADVGVQSWMEVSQAARWLDNGSVVRWVETTPSWPDPQRAYQQPWVTQVGAEGQGALASAAPWGLPNWFTDLERREFFQRQADAVVDRLARYVRRKLVGLASRVRHVRPRVQRLAVRPLTMSVTVHAPPRPRCAEGPRALRQSLLAA